MFKDLHKKNNSKRYLTLGPWGEWRTLHPSGPNLSRSIKPKPSVFVKSVKPKT
jgi:hypothetical protein